LKAKKCTYAQCIVCDEVVSDLSCNTSNFIRHVEKCKPDMHAEYKSLSGSKKTILPYERNDEKKKQSPEINNLFIFKYLIVLCSLPLRLVECEGKKNLIW
jgi:hypothetical protein